MCEHVNDETSISSKITINKCMFILFVDYNQLRSFVIQQTRTLFRLFIEDNQTSSSDSFNACHLLISKCQFHSPPPKDIWHKYNENRIIVVRWQSFGSAYLSSLPISVTFCLYNAQNSNATMAESTCISSVNDDDDANKDIIGHQWSIVGDDEFTSITSVRIDTTTNFDSSRRIVRTLEFI